MYIDFLEAKHMVGVRVWLTDW